MPPAHGEEKNRALDPSLERAAGQRLHSRIASLSGCLAGSLVYYITLPVLAAQRFSRDVKRLLYISNWAIVQSKPASLLVRRVT